MDCGNGLAFWVSQSSVDLELTFGFDPESSSPLSTYDGVKITSRQSTPKSAALIPKPTEP